MSTVIAHGDAAGIDLAAALRGRPGVMAVTADAFRRQLIVRYDGGVTNEQSLREAAWPRRRDPGSGRGLSRMRLLASTASIAAGLL